jgi:general secretion pathway protein D
MRTILNCFVVLHCLCCAALAQQTNLEGRITASDVNVQKQLAQKISLELRDATLQEALFTVRDLARLNIVVGNEITGTVNATFTSTEVHQVLDSLLIPRGYSYRIVSGSLIILPVGEVGDRLPNFSSATIQLQSNAIVEILEIVKSMLSPEGRAYAISSSNTILVMDYADRVKDIERQVKFLEDASSRRTNQTSASQNGSTNATAGFITEIRVFRPQYVPVDQLMESIRPMVSTTGTISALKTEDKLIIRDTADNLDTIEKAILELDTPRLQLRIWARIYDCAIEDLKACGINFNAGANGTSLAADGSLSQSAVMGSVTAPVGAAPNGVLTMTTINRLGTLQAVVQALETAKDTRLLADPNIIVMNHEKAMIQIITEIPFQQLTQGTLGGPIGTTSFREAGVSMDVIPHIARDQTISLVINPKFSILTGYSSGTVQAPIIDRREAKTTVRVENLQTLVLGGLRQRTRTVEQNGIPGLKTLPYVGRLFRFDRQHSRESELLVFITPELVDYCYNGSPRESCYEGQLLNEIETTPTAPVPFGKEAMRAEQAAYDQAINDQLHRNRRQGVSPDAVSGRVVCEPCSAIIGGYGNEAK